jgi:hypothetical protein
LQAAVEDELVSRAAFAKFCDMNDTSNTDRLLSGYACCPSSSIAGIALLELEMDINLALITQMEGLCRSKGKQASSPGFWQNHLMGLSHVHLSASILRYFFLCYVDFCYQRLEPVNNNGNCTFKVANKGGICTVQSGAE